jgi:hypothetical protein
VPRPRHSASPFVAEDSPCLGGSKSPDDGPPTAVCACGPGARAITESLKRVDSIPTMTLAGPETGLDFGRVEPAAMLGCVVRREPRPERRPLLRAEGANKGTRPVQVQIVHEEMNRRGVAVATRNPLQCVDETGTFAVVGGVRQMPTRLGARRCSRRWRCPSARTRSPRGRSGPAP